MNIDQAVKEQERKKTKLKWLKEQKKNAKIEKENQRASRVTLTKTGEGISLSIKHMPFLHRFIGFDLNGFWFAFCTAVVIPIFGFNLLLNIFKNAIPDITMRVLMSIMLDFSACVNLYAIYIFLRYPKLRILITKNNHYAIFSRNKKKPKKIGTTNKLRFSTYKKSNGFGTLTLKCDTHSYEYSRLSYNDIKKIEDFARNNNLR